MPWQKSDMEKADDAPFNMAMGFYIHLLDLIKRKDEAYLSDDLNGWYKGLDRIFYRIIFMLDNDERIKIKGLLNAVVDVLDPKKLKDIDEELVLLMDKYKMIFPRIDGVQGFDKIRKRFNLDKEN
jgi:hypothetical protein